MQQPQGFINSQFPSFICKLRKSLYGLKQVPRAWFDCFTTQLLTFGFVASKADPSLFIRNSSDTVTYLLLYVDDILLTGSDASYIDSLVCQLQSHFDMTNLGTLKYFLGLEIN